MSLITVSLLFCAAIQRGVVSFSLGWLMSIRGFLRRSLTTSWCPRSQAMKKGEAAPALIGWLRETRSSSARNLTTSR
jgi:hypothetical protein